MTDDTATAENDVGTNREALAVRPFRRLAGAWVVSNFGDSALYITAAIWMKDLTGSNSAAGLTFVALGLPALFAPLTGQLADRFPRKNVLVVNNFAAAAIVLPLLLVHDSRLLWLIFVSIFLYANTGYLTAAAQSGLIRAMLPDRLLAPANGLLSSIDQGLRIISPLIGAGLYALWGMDAVVLLTAACFLATGLVLVTLQVDEPAREPDPDETFWRRTTAGLRFLTANVRLRGPLLTVFICIAATGMINAVAFAAIEYGVHKPPEFISVIVSLQGVLAVAGGLTASRVIKFVGLETTMAAGVGLSGLAIALFATDSLMLFCLGSCLLGLGITWMIVAFVTLRQTETPHRLQGRVSAAANLAFNLPQVFTAAVGASLLGLVDYRILILATTLACLLSMIPVLRGRRRTARGAPEFSQKS
ncbi:MFS transporter [Spelaeicoccus albus]|uniref:MFS family permease n=1 Tax=Spelaeicoccus albus TaxID=1280376 RepID=A0A7Z0A892_9MICO|nr:MFS transporter [Spelaeicoccus albus]NYI66247.1 MFS family permease [Spelaeicoccus albus]